MDTVARLVVVFVHIPENWPGWARALYYLASPILFPLWLVGLVIRTTAYALICISALLMLAIVEFRAVCAIIADTVREGGAESYAVMPNVGRVEEA